MGEHRSFRIVRAVGMGTLVVAAAAVLSSCAQTGALAGATSSPTASATVAPTTTSTPTATPTQAPTEPVASDTPAPVTTPVATSAPTSAAGGRAAVVPFITTADWNATTKALDVSAIVPDVVEPGGTCTVTVTSGATVRTAKSDGVAASSYTGCEAVSITGLTPGTWEVRVRYTSTKAAGDSAEREVRIR